MDRINLGKLGEEAATEYLLQQGYRIMERNFRCTLGELDIIAEDGDYLVFIEVRSRHGVSFGLPQETVNWAKQRKLKQLASFYLKIKNSWKRKCRFDVLGVIFDQQTKVKSIELIKDAF